jgi:hypothetical protein
MTRSLWVAGALALCACAASSAPAARDADASPDTDLEADVGTAADSDVGAGVDADGDADAGSDEDADDDADAGADADAGSDAETDADAATDSGADAGADADADASNAPCPPGAACPALPEPGLPCPLACIPQPDALTCAGAVIADICYPPGSPGPAVADPPVTVVGPLRITLVAKPPPSLPGQTHTLTLSVENLGASALALPFGTTGSTAWSLDDGNFLDWVELAIPAGQSRSITATLTALRPDRFDLNGGEILTFYMGDLAFTVHAGVDFGPGDVPEGAGIPCGTHVFPATWCGDEACTPATRYLSARCCDGAFFPGATCCSSADCPDGACVDGTCVASAPHLDAANTLLHGPQRVLLVIADYPELATADPCADRSAELRDTLGLDTVETWFRGHSLARTGQDLVDFRWTVLAGLDSAAILPPAADPWVVLYRDHLAAWLATHAAAGCPDLATFDKVLIAAKGADLKGSGGLYLGEGLIGLGSYLSPFLIAHELTHSYGATDLGRELADAFLYPQALMGTYPAADATDQVAWGEIGYGDLDRDGVIDIFRYAATPAAIAVDGLTAHIEPADATTPEPHLSLRWRFVDPLSPSPHLVYLPRFRVTLHGVGPDMPWYDALPEKRLVFAQSALKWDALLAAGSITVSLKGALHVTQPDGSSETLTVDYLQTVPLSP